MLDGCRGQLGSGIDEMAFESESMGAAARYLALTKMPRCGPGMGSRLLQFQGNALEALRLGF